MTLRLIMTAGFTGALLLAGAAARTAPGPDGDAAALARRLEAIKQPAELTKWQRIPWLTDLGEAVRVAREEKRPLFLWASGDDPLERC